MTTAEIIDEIERSPLSFTEIREINAAVRRKTRMIVREDAAHKRVVLRVGDHVRLQDIRLNPNDPTVQSLNGLIVEIEDVLQYNARIKLPDGRSRLIELCFCALVQKDS